jgi:hypothetical protein
LSPRDDAWEAEAASRLLAEAPMDLATASRLVAA